MQAIVSVICARAVHELHPLLSSSGFRGWPRAANGMWLGTTRKGFYRPRPFSQTASHILVEFVAASRRKTILHCDSGEICKNAQIGIGPLC
jgi:hypothetical protein